MRFMCTLTGSDGNPLPNFHERVFSAPTWGLAFFYLAQIWPAEVDVQVIFISDVDMVLANVGFGKNDSLPN